MEASGLGLKVPALAVPGRYSHAGRTTYGRLSPFTQEEDFTLIRRAGPPTEADEI
jgi:hypothetical protein